MTYTYKPHGVCSRQMEVEIEDGIVVSAKIVGGCDGNSKGVCSLVKGMKVEEAISRMKGIDCGGRGTSCPDQLARAIEEAVSNS